MKEIKYYDMKEIKYYEASDGALFPTKERCEEYEMNLTKTIIDNFKKLIIRESEGIKLTKEGSAFPFAEIAECWWYAVIVMHDDFDYDVVTKYKNLISYRKNKDIPKIFNKEIIVAIGEGSSEKCNYNEFYWCGTVEDAIANYTKTLLTFNLKGE